MLTFITTKACNSWQLSVGCHQDEDCGSCVNCKDIKKFRGPGIRRH